MKKMTITISVLFILSLWAGSAYALGLGMYVPLGAGESEHTIEQDYGPDIKFDNDFSYHGLGFVLDTNVAGQSIFNYRLNVGFESGEYDPEKNYHAYSDSLDYDRLAVDNTFGFGVFQNEAVRIWVGPQVRLAYLHSDESVFNDELNAFGFGIGPVAGVNFHIGPTVSLSFDTGYRLTRYYGSFDDNDNNEYDHGDTKWRSEDGELFVNFAVIFRINDVYQ